MIDSDKLLETNPDALMDVRLRLGADNGLDASKDHLIRRMSADDFLREYCAWHGMPGWGHRILDVHSSAVAATTQAEGLAQAERQAE